jgi:hypothetical protein
MSNPATISMRDEDWRSLVYSVEQGNCILMLGPDAVSVWYEDEVVPVLIGLARFVKDKLGPDFAYLDASKPSAVAQVAVDREDPTILQGWVREFYEHARVTSSVLEDLAALPFGLVINTSPVLGIGEAFATVKPGTVVDYYDRTAPMRPTLPDPSVDEPLIYNLYGSLEHPDSLVLSDDDRLDFVVSVITDNPPVPAKLRSALRDESRSLLFLGFSLDQWQLRLLVHVLAKAHRRYKSFALELEPSKLDVETALFYGRGHRIQFPDMDLGAFIRELRDRVGDTEVSAEKEGDRGGQFLPGTPKVFICHASEDKAYAEYLAGELKEHGISTWFDSVIRHAIKEEIQYFIVLQSASLVTKEIGYVNKEIDLALDRQKEYRSPRRFLIPVVIDSRDNMLSELVELQSIDLSASAGIDVLVKEINRDLSLASRES